MQNPSTKPKRNRKNVSVCLTEREKTLIEEKARATGFLSTSEYLRALGLNKALPLVLSAEPDSTPIQRADPALLAALGRLGNNCNQIARTLNTLLKHKDLKQEDILATLKILNHVRVELERLRDNK
jgi:hypothetical protein